MAADSFERWLLRSLWVDVDQDWRRVRFGRFRFWKWPLSRAELMEAIESGTDHTSQYLSENMSPKTYAYLLFVVKALELVEDRQMFNYEFFRMELSEDTKSWGPNFPGLEELPRLIVASLIELDEEQSLANLIRFLYSSYEDFLRKLLEESDDRESWLLNIRILVPRLLLKNFIPVHDQISTGGEVIAVPNPQDTSHPTFRYDDNTVSRVSLIYRELFADDEIHYFEQSGQRMTEMLAHLFTLLIMNIDETIERKRNSIFRDILTHGRLSGKQLALLYYRSELSIPKYVYREIVRKI